MLFIYITIFTILIQMAMVEYGGTFVKAYPLSFHQNMICMAIGAMELINGLLLKFIPLKFFQCVSLDETPINEANVNTTFTSALKKSSVMMKRNQPHGHDTFRKLHGA